MLNEFVERICVHERDKKGSRNAVQDVDIYFNFVGKYVPPHFREVELTPEEQEELRKKQERKEKLHQAYLNRKASGKQQEYEREYNAKRKARVEGRKAALRAEDMKKGVYAIASSLPIQEPQRVNTQA